MPQALFKVIAVSTNGPFAYWSQLDGVNQKVVTGIASIGAAIDAIKADVPGLNLGPISSVTINVAGAP